MCANAEKQSYLIDELAEDEQRWQCYPAGWQAVPFDSVRKSLHRLVAQA